LSRTKLIKKLREKYPDLNQFELETILDTFTKSISDALVKGNSVEIRGLGRWYGKKLKENFNARNPANNKLIYKPERIKIRFKASKKLNKIINE
tara:strand:+ start:212 stop:493 length:282 start_codon:yes stop_codon:yes gene_type:complete